VLATASVRQVRITCFFSGAPENGQSEARQQPQTIEFTPQASQDALPGATPVTSALPEKPTIEGHVLLDLDPFFTSTVFHKLLIPCVRLRIKVGGHEMLQTFAQVHLSRAVTLSAAAIPVVSLVASAAVVSQIT